MAVVPRSLRCRVIPCLVLLGAIVPGGCTGADAESVARAKVGFVLIGGKDDLGYNQAIYDGSVVVARAFPDHEVLRTYGVPETPAAVDAMEDLVVRGARVIFATSYFHRDAAVEVARRHPDVVVLHQGGVKVEGAPANFGTYWGTMYEPVYQAGIAAGAATKTGKLGFVAAFPIPAAYNNINAFTLGARSVNPFVTTTLVFTGNWCDPDRQAVAVRQLIDAGIDVLAQHQDCTRMILEAAETAAVRAVGYHYDGSEVAPHAWLVGAVWDWDQLFVDMTRAALGGTFRTSPYSGNFRGGLRTGDNPFVLTEYGPGLDRATGEAIEAAARRFESGTTPFDGPLSDRDGQIRVRAGERPDRAQIDSMTYLVPGVIGDPPRS